MAEAQVGAEATTASETTVRAPARDLKELRLGLVCYGGVSLAIYMHGSTKEIQRAVRASVFEERGIASHDEAKSEQAYRDLLRSVAAERNVETRIVVDTIAGSSAGGINGIFLAKALAHNLGQDGLRDLWFVHGDLEAVTRRPTGITGHLARLIARLLPVGGGVPTARARRKLVAAALQVYRAPILYGHQMANWIYEALQGMPSPEPWEPASLMPERHFLGLAVTVTDHFGYRRDLPITDPRLVAEAQHRHLLEFHYRTDDTDDFRPDDDAALALAARGTSSLPAGFPSVNLDEFVDILPPGAATTAKLSRFFRAYELADADPAWAYLEDGGVLDNKPFGPVLRAIKQRHAANEVDRYLVFLEPDPHPPEPPATKPGAPSPPRALVGGLSGLPRSEPILDELHDVLVTNARVRAVRDVIETSWEAVERRVRRRLPDLDDPPADAGSPVLKVWNDRMHEAAQAEAGLGYGMYLRLKIGSAVDAYATAASVVCDYTDESSQAYLVNAVVREWARSRNLFAKEMLPTDEQRAFLRDFDLGYGARRLRFVIAGVSWLYRDAGPDPTDGYPSRQQLDAVKERLYQGVAKLEWLSSGRGFGDEVLGGIHTCFGEERVSEYLREHGFDVHDFVVAHRAALEKLEEALRSFLGAELEGFTAELYRDLIALTATWDTKVRRDLLVRYLGFPIWDAMLYPIQALSDVAERDEVRVVRFSPRDSTLLTPAQGPKVLGAGLGHAYAFFSREARENDYLWGRLDTAERMVRLLLTTRGPADELVSGELHARYRSWCKRVFLALLDEEAAALPNVQPLVTHLRSAAEALAD
jgi:patatin-related protein